MPELSNLLIPPVLFFLLGAAARLFRSDLEFPPDLTRALSIYLLAGIGLHGGAELASASLSTALGAIAGAVALGVLLPLLAHRILIDMVRLSPLDAAAVAAHYGSVSAGTFLAATAWLQARSVQFESYPLIMLAVMESPAIVIGLLLAQAGRRANAVPSVSSSKPRADKGRIVLDALRHGSIVLLLGCMVIGALISPKSLQAINPFFQSIFSGVLCLYLLELGMVAAARVGEFRRLGGRLIAFALLMPLIGAVCGMAVALGPLGMGAGGATLVAVLGASASYIAVPPAMRMAIPEANPSIYLTLSLGLTFPFNVLIGIPLYFWIASQLAR